ncbi:homeotic protein female sterile-like [Drosophila subobscura]|uniref:homeotic protein female sterile-like n=1 Tax=Drosophila subobscura TaxID=7241 RepID=UPI00155AF8EC|nr:homeotic protein female sterile-like [Drosophila subobscura]
MIGGVRTFYEQPYSWNFGRSKIRTSILRQWMIGGVRTLRHSVDNQNPKSPRCAQPVNGIVQPQVMPPPNRKGRVTNFLLKLRTAVNALSRNPSSLHFRRPVDAVKLNIRDYYEKIANPMDLNTIKKRFEYTYYWGGADVLEDILLIFENCRTYNSPDSTVFKAAVTLCECFWLSMAKMQQELHKECRAEAKTRRPRKASISKTSPLPKTPRQEKAVIPKKTNVEIEDLNQPKADDPLPSFWGRSQSTSESAPLQTVHACDTGPSWSWPTSGATISKSSC